MGTELMKCYNDLQKDLEDAKVTLIGLNDNIRRIVGRNLKDLRPEKSKTITLEKEGINGQTQINSDAYKVKRRQAEVKSVFNRLSAPNRDNETDTKPRINSHVIRELPTRQEVVAAQGIDSESRARNRRIFGSLMGTLHKFCQEESRLKQKEEKKAQIEKKLEEQEIQEREQIKKERETLFMDRRKKQSEIRRIEWKINRLKDLNVWESSIKYLRNQIRTKTKPYLYYRPRVMSNTTDALLVESQRILDVIKENKLEQFNKEFDEYSANLKAKNFELGNSLNNDEISDSQALCPVID